MLTRRAQSASSEGAAKQILENTYAPEDIVGDEVVSYICRLPATLDELGDPDALDVLTLREFALLAQGLNLPYETAPEILASEERRKEGLKSTIKREKSLRLKAAIMKILLSEYESNWEIIHDYAIERKEYLKRNKIPFPVLELLPRKPHAQSPPQVDVSPVNPKSTEAISEIDYLQCPVSLRYQENQNLALKEVQIRKQMPTRDELIFLTDIEYERMVRLHSCLHGQELPSFSSNAHDQNSHTTHDSLVLEYLLGTMRETNYEIDSCLETADQLCSAAHALQSSTERKRTSRESLQKERLARLIEAQEALSASHSNIKTPGDPTPVHSEQ